MICTTHVKHVFFSFYQSTITELPSDTPLEELTRHNRTLQADKLLPKQTGRKIAATANNSYAARYNRKKYLHHSMVIWNRVQTSYKMFGLRKERGKHNEKRTK